MGANVDKKAIARERRGRHSLVVHPYYLAAEPRIERQAKALLDRGVGVDLICPQEPDEPAIAKADGVGVYRLLCVGTKANA